MKPAPFVGLKQKGVYSGAREAQTGFPVGANPQARPPPPARPIIPNSRANSDSQWLLSVLLDAIKPIIIWTAVQFQRVPNFKLPPLHRGISRWRDAAELETEEFFSWTQSADTSINITMVVNCVLGKVKRVQKLTLITPARCFHKRHIYSPLNDNTMMKTFYNNFLNHNLFDFVNLYRASQEKAFFQGKL